MQKTINLFYFLLPVLAGFASCSTSNNEGSGKKQKNIVPAGIPKPAGHNGFAVDINGSDTSQVSTYIRRIFQDSRGRIWFGTTQDGVCCYDGKTLTYFNPKNGLAGYCVSAIMEDSKGNLWFGTFEGLSKYDGRSFTNYTVKDGMVHNNVWGLTEDNNGNIWIGTYGGVCYFDGRSFTHFPISWPAVKHVSEQPEWILHMFKDKAGNLWFGSHGAGACRYNVSLNDSAGRGERLTYFTQKDGLCNNNVSWIFEDSKGRLWFASRWNAMDGGVSCYEGKKFTRYTTREGLSGTKGVMHIFEDKKGDLWFGPDRFDGSSFSSLSKKDGLTQSVFCVFEDNKGKYWIGTGGGLFRYDGRSVINVRKNGPWE